MFNTDKKLVIESFIQLTLLLKLFVLERFNQCLEWLSEFTMMFIISYLFIVIGDSRLLPFKKLSFPPPLWLSYTFSSFYLNIKHPEENGTYAGIHTNVRNIIMKLCIKHFVVFLVS